jgi:glyoxalase family protein
MNPNTRGIHHVTAIGGDAQRNVDFYAGLLGLRLVKRTVNFDDPETYHLYYGDGSGNPGSIVTFFPWGDDAPKGRIGAGQVMTTSFSIPAASLGYWMERLVENGRRFEKPRGSFGETTLTFEDPDGLRVELVAAEDERPGWDSPTVPAEHAVRGIHHVTLIVAEAQKTAELLTGALGFERAGKAEGRGRFAAGGGPGTLVDVSEASGFPRGTMGSGTVHHVAFRAEDEESELAFRERVESLGFEVTRVLDRNYFRSIYFREPGGVLFEIATDPPGFAVDEPPEELGSNLKLPAWLEERRERIEEVLPPLHLPGEDPR